MVELVSQQVKNNYQVTVAYLKKDPYWQEKLESLGVKVIDLNLTSLYSYFINRNMRKLLQELRPDLVHAHMAPAELLTRISLLGSSIPLVISKHNDKRFAPIPFENILMKWVSIRASKIIAISDSVKKYMTNRGIPQDQICRIYYGIDVNKVLSTSFSDILKLKEELHIQDDDLVFGTLSRLVPQKSLDTMIKGFHLFMEKTGTKSKLIIVGRGDVENGQEERRLKALVNKLNLNSTVVLTGFREDAYSLLKIFDCFLLTSIHEGLGLVLLEAMSASKPIIASKISAIPEIVDKAGILITPRSPEELSMAMIDLQNVSVREELGNKGKNRVESLFTLEKMFSNTHSIYEEVLSN